MALLSLYLPCSFFVSSMRSQSLSPDLTPSSSSASSTRTPVSWKKQCSSRSWIVYLRGAQLSAGPGAAGALPPRAPLPPPPLVLVHADAALDDLLQLRHLHLVEAAGLQALGAMGISACCAGHCHSAGFPEPGAEPRLCRVMVLLDAARTAVAPQPLVSPDTAPLAAGHTRGHAPSPGAALARLWFPRPSRVCLHGARTPQGSGFPPQQAGANRDRLGQPSRPAPVPPH